MAEDSDCTYHVCLSDVNECTYSVQGHSGAPHDRFGAPEDLHRFGAPNDHLIARHRVPGGSNVCSRACASVAHACALQCMHARVGQTGRLIYCFLYLQTCTQPRAHRRVTAAIHDYRQTRRCWCVRTTVRTHICIMFQRPIPPSLCCCSCGTVRVVGSSASHPNSRSVPACTSARGVHAAMDTMRCNIS